MNLTLEITRRCNMACCHCLRGGPQRVDMDNHTIFKVLYHWPFQNVGIVNFTGGEPSLRPDRIREFWQNLLWQKKGLDGWELTTNAKHITEDFLDALERLTWHADDKSLCSIRISDDHFHRSLRLRDDKDKLYRWGEEHDVHVYADNNLDQWEDKLLGMGRAKKYQLGFRDPDDATNEWEYWIDDNEELGYCDGYMYVNVHGQIINGCDFSFTEQKKRVLGSVLSDNLTEIILRNGHPQRSQAKDVELAGSLQGFEHDEGDDNAEKDNPAGAPTEARDTPGDRGRTDELPAGAEEHRECPRSAVG